MTIKGSSEEFDKIRFWLFTETYIADEIKKFLKRKYKIPPKMSSEEWRRRAIREHWNLLEQERKRWEDILKRRVEIDAGFLWVTIPKIENQIIPEIPKLAKILDLNETLLKVFILYNNVPYNLYPPNRLFFATPLSPITDMGYYIKIDENLTEKELLALFKDAKQKINIIFEDKKRTKYQKRRRKQFGKDEEAKITAFVLVEKKIKEIAEENLKLNKKHDLETYYKDIVQYAIGAVTQNILDKLKYNDETQDKVFCRVQKKITTYYYTIAKRYKLPTPKRLSSILKLMQS